MGLTANRTYITPLKSDGTEAASAPGTDATLTGRGVFTLEAATTYYFPLPIASSAIYDVHLQHDAAIAITSATIETTSMGETEVTNISSTAGAWADQDPSTAYVATVGATTTHTNGVGAVVAGNVGCLDWQVSASGAHRGRLKVVVGATGGEVRLGFCGKQ
jgi:hypothetical protein